MRKPLTTTRCDRKTAVRSRFSFGAVSASALAPLPPLPEADFAPSMAMDEDEEDEDEEDDEDEEEDDGEEEAPLLPLPSAPLSLAFEEDDDFGVSSTAMTASDCLTRCAYVSRFLRKHRSGSAHMAS